MIITQHGFWQLVPPHHREDEEQDFSSILFATRESDGVDWYEFSRSDALSDDAVKMIAVVPPGQQEMIISTVSRDATMLFPAAPDVPGLLLEVSGLEGTDEEIRSAYVGRIFDPETNEINGPFQPVPQYITDRQFFQALALRGIITRDEALAAVATGAIPPEMEHMISQHTPDEQFAIRMYLAGQTQFDRYHTLVALFAEDFQLTTGQMDDIWRLGSTL